MTYRRRHKKRKPPKKKATQQKKRTVVWWQIWKYSKKAYAIIGVVFVILGWFSFKDQIDKWTITKHEKFEQEKYIRGVFIPPNLLHSYDTLIFEYGSSYTGYVLHKLENGIEVKLRGFAIDGQAPFGLKFKITNNRLYVNTVIKDIHGDVSGIIEFEKWKLVKANMLNYNETDESLEIIDDQNNVVFSMIYIMPNKLSLKGYFVNLNKIMVIGDFIAIYNTDQENRNKIMREIEKIPRIGSK